MSQLGALDTKTSVQVMELLKKISQDRLIIMVTHNSELAEKYNLGSSTLEKTLLENMKFINIIEISISISIFFFTFLPPVFHI